MAGRVATYTNIVGLLGAFLATSVVLGLLGAGLMMPVAGAAGATARQGVHVFDDLPGEFTRTPLSQQSRILASDGTVIATPFDENRIIVPLAQIAPVMRQAQIAVEDSRFYEHGGVDLYGVGRAFVANLGGGYTQGASTLTQQYVKITLQENALRNNDRAGALAATAKSYTRKSPGAQVRRHAGEEPHQEPDPRGLLQPRLLRRPGVRGRGGGSALLRGERSQAEPGSGCDPGGSCSAAEHLRPDPSPRRSPGPTQHCPRSDAQAWADHRQGLDGRQEDQDGDPPQTRSKLMRALALPLLLQLCQRVAPGPASFGQDARGPAREDQPRRADDQDNAQPQDAAGRSARAHRQGPDRQPRGHRRRGGRGRTRHRPRAGHCPEHDLFAQERDPRQDLGELGGRSEVWRVRRVRVRLERQDVRRR